MKIKKITLILLAMLLLICSLSTISAANNTISDTSTGGILQGITDTGNGDTLFLNPGTYNKTNQDTNITISKNITIQGNGSKDTVIIDARGLSRIFILTNNYNMTFINVTFLNGNTTGNGAAINGALNTGLIVINCSFKNNQAPNGGAIYAHKGNISESIFINNSATLIGAAVYKYLGNITITNSIFINNTVPVTGSGGAVYSYNDSIDIIGCNFSDNIIASGSGVYAHNCNINIINSTFTNNRAFRYGGAVFSQNSTLIMNNCNFTNNVGTTGGAIHNTDNSTMTVIESVFINNTAISIGGGAIFNTNGSSGNPATLILIGSTFINNTAIDFGGAIFNHYAFINLSGNTMSGNYARLGQMIYNNGTMGILNLTYLSNSTIQTTNGSTISIYATLTDDIGNTVTGQDISFYVDGVFIGNITSIEGQAEISYLVTQEPGSIIPVTGYYAGNGEYSILINNGELSIPLTPDPEIIPHIPNKPEDPNNPKIPETPKKPKNPDDPNPKNDPSKTSNNPVASSAMKETGMPINLILLVLLSCLGIIIRKKQ